MREAVAPGSSRPVRTPTATSYSPVASLSKKSSMSETGSWRSAAITATTSPRGSESCLDRAERAEVARQGYELRREAPSFRRSSRSRWCDSSGDPSTTNTTSSQCLRGLPRARRADPQRLERLLVAVDGNDDRVGRMARGHAAPRRRDPPRRPSAPDSREVSTHGRRVLGDRQAHLRESSSPNRLSMICDRIVDVRAIPACSSFARAAARSSASTTARCATWSRPRARRGGQRSTRERSHIGAIDTPTGRIGLVEVRQPRAQHCSLQFVEPGVPATRDRDPVLGLPAVLAERTRSRGNLVGVGRDRSAVAERGEVLRRIEAERRHVSEGSRQPAARRAPMA